MSSNSFFIFASLLIAFGIYNSALVFAVQQDENIVVHECDKNSCKIGQLCVASVNGSSCIDSKSVMKKRHSTLEYLSWKTGFWLLVPLLSYLLAQPIVYLFGRFLRLRKWIRKSDLKAVDGDTQLRSLVRAKVIEMSEH